VPVPVPVLAPVLVSGRRLRGMMAATASVIRSALDRLFQLYSWSDKPDDESGGLGKLYGVLEMRLKWNCPAQLALHLSRRYVSFLEERQGEHHVSVQ
jgi:hypothetical protein